MIIGTIKSLLSFAVILGLFFFDTLCAQQNPNDPNGLIRAALEAQVHAMFGSQYTVKFFVMDSLVGKTLEPNDEMIIDPYQTLQGCVFFETRRSVDSLETIDSLIVGVFKNGQIIWYDDHVRSGSFGHIFAATDLNHDGEVDVLSVYDELSDQWTLSYMWIFSWNGLRGRVLNDIDPRDGQSVIVSQGGLFELFQIAEDSTQRIRGQVGQGFVETDFTYLQGPTLPWVTYGWNGSLYGFWPSIHQVAGKEFLPANLASVSCKCVVSSSGNSCRYQYAWRNDQSSRQRIRAIYLGNTRQAVGATGPVHWEPLSSSRVHGRKWYVFDNFKSSMINPGQTASGFEINSLSLPAIVEYYVQGYRPESNAVFDSTDLSENDLKNDILTNSIKGYTIAAQDPPSPFNRLNFLDSLKSYVLQSRSLGWITSQSSADTYALLIDSAKARLQRNDSLSAHRALDTVIQHAVADSASVLSSEAFALIFFNAQYLLAQMSPAPVGYIITATASVNGSIHPQGGNSVGDGGTLTFTIRPNPGYHIAGVFIDNADTSVGTDSTYIFRNVTANHTISAFFAVDRYRIIAGAGDGGSIDPHDTVFVDYGSGQSFAITANSGYAVRGLVVDGTARPAASTYAFSNVTSNHTITADFRTNTYTITASAGAGGTIDPAGALIVTSGASKSFTITPNPGYTIGKVTVDGVSRGSIRAYTFTKIVSSHTISASFNQTPCLPPCCIDAPASVDRLTLTDTNGNRKTLLVRNADRPLAAGLNDSLLAAQAGTGTLASGFQSRQSVESVSPGQPATVIKIWVREASYPLVLTVNENPRNNVQYWLIRPGQPDAELTDATSKQIEGLETGILEIRVRAGQPCQEQ
ncbi:MAG: hypothetical protein ABSF91_15170 [Bacteroidota bacterium]|jgi:hypothetical protein